MVWLSRLAPGFFFQQSPDHVFQQVFHRQNVPGRDVQPARKGGFPRQSGDEKIPQHILLLQHAEAAVEKLGQNDEIHPYVPLGGGEDLVVDRLVQQQQVPSLQR